MTTINELLAQYNAVAPKPLKTWKASKAALLRRIELAENKAAEASVKPAKKTNGHKLNGTLSVVQIASELNINPKVARAKLRRKGMAANNGRWDRVKRDSNEYKDIVAALGR